MAGKKLTRNFRILLLKKLKKKGVFLATLYLETNEFINKNSKVEVFGNFTNKPWS